MKDQYIIRNGSERAARALVGGELEALALAEEVAIARGSMGVRNLASD